jgi:hypothetical protein
LGVENKLEQLLERPSRPFTPRAGPAWPARILEAGVIYRVKEELVYMGVDIAKSYLDAAIGNEKRRFSNDTIGHRELIKWVKRVTTPVQVICESSEGYERALVQRLARARSKSVWSKPTGYGNLRERLEFWPRPIVSMPRCCANLVR